MPKFDDLLLEIGDFGRYQLKFFLLISLVGIPSGFNMVGQVFYADKTMDHWCAEEGLSAEYEACTAPGAEPGDSYIGCLHALRNISIPQEMDDDGTLAFSKCTKMAEGGEDVIGCDQGWIYDRSEWQDTIISDFDLVCDRKSAPDIAQSVFFAGVLVGSFVFGSVSDVLGRFKTFYIALGFLAGFSVLNVFSPNFWVYIILRFFIASANLGTFICAFVMGTELVGPSKRVLTNALIQSTFAIGIMLLSVSAYFIRDWRMIQLSIAVPTFAFFLAIPFVYESPRWLISKGRYKDAEKIIIHIAKFNKNEAKLPTELAQKLQTAEECGEEPTDAGGTVTVVDLMKRYNLRMSMLNLMYNWFINSLVYYGLSLSTSDLGSNVYIACFISGAVEIPAYLIGIPMMESRLGRRYSTSLLELLGGVACLLTIFLPLGAWKTTVAMVGKFAISASFSLIYIYTAEILPTPLRGIGVGVCSTASRVGGVLCPLILMLDEVWKPLPLIIFSTSAILGGICVTRLPESRGKKLPETIEEGERFNTPKRRRKRTDRDISYRGIPAGDV